MHLPKLTQKGFATIPLLILLVVGITAGTLLVQNRTNFLPQAAEELTTTSRDIKQSCLDHIAARNITIGSHYGSGNLKNGCRTSFYVTDIRPHNITECRVSLEEKYEPGCVPGASCTLSDETVIAHTQRKELGCSATQPGKFLTELCQNGNAIKEYRDDPSCSPTQKKPCKFADGREFSSGTSISTCSADPLHTGEIFIQTCDDGQITRSYEKHSACTISQPAAPTQGAPATQTQCNSTQARDCNPDSCIVENGLPKCVGKPTTPNSGAQPGTIGVCKTPLAGCTSPKECKEDAVGSKWCVDPKWTEGGSCGNGCVVIGGLPKNPYPDNTDPNGCNEADKRVCPASEGKKCTVFTKPINGKTYWYSACERTAAATATQPRPGAPTGGTAPRPNTATGAQPAAGGNTSRSAAGTGTSSTGQGQTNVVNTNRVQEELICGKDANNLSIPCYAIGVFSPQELTSREAQTKIAAINYEKFRTILKEQEEKIGKEIAANAEKKMAEAEGALKACMQ